MKFANIHHIYFVGIGGIGMSGIAEILLNQGFRVSGSDLSMTEVTEHLRDLGATIHEGHDPENLTDVDVLVYSSAVVMDNPEVIAAIDRKIPVIRRAEMLAEVMRLHHGIAIAGTHGKTTTTSMLGLVLIEGKKDPTVIVGGKLHAFGGTNARLGSGEFMVVEADEYDRSFLKLNPSIAVLTSLEAEHLDIYSNLDDLKTAFVEFANKIPFYGFVTLCLDESALQEILPQIKRKVVTYGFSSQADIQAVDLKQIENRSRFTVMAWGKELGQIDLGVPGEHNVQNALAAVTVSLQLGIAFDSIKEALDSFAGAFRRFEVKAIVGDIMVVDDYAHHPTEVQVTLRGIKAGWRRRVICVFQPHTYTRTRDFYKDFGRSFMNADMLIVTDVYPARESAIQGISGELISDAARSFGHKNVRYVPDKQDIPTLLREVVLPGDIVITMGAGDIYQYGARYIELLEKHV
ncbi:MAG: UDP-N-acetylmuramate--L-alanine ligase [Ignavibacteria bacterium]|nr:MAG: UDP-N-acetylmuramate--L-alanine ligase [Ignavibacteria bacterium]